MEFEEEQMEFDDGADEGTMLTEGADDGAL